MRKTLYDIMNASDDCITEFERVCADLASAKYILAEKKISAVLQTIAKSKKLYAFINACMQKFDFAAELAKAKKTTQSGRAILALPSDRKTNIAFVFCLLLSFDTNQTDFKKFLHTFYDTGESANTGVNIEYAEFAEFAKSVVMPFCDDVVTLYYAEGGYKVASHRAGNDTVASAGAYGTEWQESDQPADNGSELSAFAAQSLASCAREMIGIVARDPLMHGKEREEILLICEAFIQAANLRAAKPVRTMHIALKNTIKCLSGTRFEAQSADLERLIAENGLD